MKLPSNRVRRLVGECPVSSGPGACKRKALLALALLLAGWTHHAAGFSVVLTWDSNSETDLAGYNLYYGTSSRQYSQVLPAGLTNIITVSNLVVGVEYFFAVTAFNTSGLESDFSNEVSYRMALTTNVPPVFKPVAAAVLAEDGSTSVPLTIEDPDSPPSALQVTASTADSALLGSSSLTLQGAGTNWLLGIRPSPDQHGSGTVTVSASDGQSTFSTNIAITVQPVNDPPTLAPIGNVTLTGTTLSSNIMLTGISPGAANEFEAVTVTAVSSDPSLVPHPQVTYVNPGGTGVLGVTRVAGAVGSATISVTVDDGQSFSNTIKRVFAVTLQGAAPPVFAPITVPALQEDGSTTITVAVSDPDSPANSLRLSADVSATDPLFLASGIVVQGTGVTWRVNLKPKPDQFGTTSLGLWVTDGQTTTVTNLAVVVTAVNDQPTLDPIAPIKLTASGRSQTILLTGISCGPANEGQSISVTATSMDTNVVAHPTIRYTSPNSTGYLVLVPGTTSGFTDVHVSVRDSGSGSNLLTRVFGVQLNRVKVTSIKTVSGDAFTLVWEGDSLASFQVVSTTNLVNGEWTPVSPVLTSTSEISSWITTPAPWETCRFYKIRVVE